MQEMVGKSVFSRTLPVGGGHTMKEYDQQISELKKENFSLKMSLYYLEENVQKRFGNGQDVFKNVELQVEIERLKQELMIKQDVLQRAALAMEALTARCEQEEIHKNELLADYQNKIAVLHEQLDKANLRLSASHDDGQSAPASTPQRSSRADKRSVTFKSLSPRENGMGLQTSCQSRALEVSPDRSQQTSARPCHSDQWTQTSPEQQGCQLLINQPVSSCPFVQQGCEIAEFSQGKERSEQVQVSPVSSDQSPVYINDDSSSGYVEGFGCGHVNVQEEQHLNKHAESLVNFSEHVDFFGDFESRRHDRAPSLKYESLCLTTTGKTLSRHITSPSTCITSPSTWITSPSIHIASPYAHITSPSQSITEISSIASEDMSRPHHPKTTNSSPQLNKSDVLQTSLTTHTDNHGDISQIDSAKSHNFMPSADTHFQSVPSILKIQGNINSYNERKNYLMGSQSRNIAVPEFSHATSTKDMQISKLLVESGEATTSSDLDRRDRFEGQVTALPKSSGDDCDPQKQGISRSTFECEGVFMDCSEVSRAVSGPLDRVGEDAADRRERSGRNNTEEDVGQERASSDVNGMMSSPRPHQRGTTRGQLLRDVMSPNNGQLTAVSGDHTCWNHILSQSNAKIKELEEKLQSTENTVRLLSRKNKVVLSAMAAQGLSVSLMGRSSSEACLDVLATPPRKRSSSVGSLSLWNCVPESKGTTIAASKDASIAPSKGTKDTIIMSYEGDSMERARSHFYSTSSPTLQDYWHSSAMTTLATPSVTLLSSPEAASKINSSDLSIMAQDSFNNLNLAKPHSNISRINVSRCKINNNNNNNQTTSSMTNVTAPTPVFINNILESSSFEDSHKNYVSSGNNINEVSRLNSPNWLSSCKDKSIERHVRFHMDKCPGENVASPDVTFSSILNSPMLNKLMANLERNLSSLLDSTFNISDLSGDQIQAHVEHLQTLNFTLKEEVAVYEALLGPPATEGSTILNEEFDSGSSGRDVLEEDILRHHLVEIRKLRKRLERLLTTEQPDHVSIIHPCTSQRAAHQDMMIATLQQQLMEQNDQRQQELSKLQHDLCQENLTVEKLELTISELQSTVQAQAETITQQEQQIINQKSDKLKLTISELQSTIRTQAETITQQEQQIINLKSDFSSRIERNGKIEEELKIMIREKTELVANWTKSEDKFSEMEKVFKFEFSNLKSESKRLEEEVDEKEEEIERLMIEVDKKEESSRQLREVLVKCERLIQEKVDWLQRLANEKVVVDGRLEMREGELRRMEAEIGKLRREMKEVRVGVEEEKVGIRAGEKVGVWSGVEEKVGFRAGENVGFWSGVEEKVGFTNGDEEVGFKSRGEEVKLTTCVEEKGVFCIGDGEKVGYGVADEEVVGFRCDDEGKVGFRSGVEGKVEFGIETNSETSELRTGLEENVVFRNEIELLKQEFIIWLEEKSWLEAEVGFLKEKLKMKEILEAKIHLQKMGYEADIERISEEKQTLRLQLESEMRLKVGLKLRIDGLEIKLTGKTILEQQIQELKEEIKSLSRLQHEVDQTTSKLGCNVFDKSKIDKLRKFDDLQSEFGVLSERVESAEKSLRVAEEWRRMMLDHLKEGEQQLRKRDKQLHHLLGQYKKLDAAFVKQTCALKEKTDLVESMKKQIHLFEVCLTCSCEDEEETPMRELLKELLATQRQVEDLLSRLGQTSSEMKLPVGTFPQKSIWSDVGVCAVLQGDCHKKILKEIRECLDTLTKMQAKSDNGLCNDTLESESCIKSSCEFCQKLHVCLMEAHRLLSTACAIENDKLVTEKKHPRPHDDQLGPSLSDQQRKQNKTSMAWETILYEQLNKTVQDLEQAKRNIDISLTSTDPQ